MPTPLSPCAAQTCIAIEPVIHVNGAVNRMAQAGTNAEKMGMCILEPHQTFPRAMRIEVEHA